MHQHNIQSLAIEIFKYTKGLQCDAVQNIFNWHNTISLRSGEKLNRSKINTVQFGENSLSFFGSKIWALVPENIKKTEWDYF